MKSESGSVLEGWSLELNQQANPRGSLRWICSFKRAMIEQLLYSELQVNTYHCCSEPSEGGHQPAGDLVLTEAVETEGRSNLV